MDMRKVEDMLAQLIQMVGTIQSEQQEMKQKIGNMEQRLGGLEQKVGNLEQKVGNLEQKVGNLEQKVGNLEQRQLDFEHKAELRHNEIMNRLNEIEMDQDIVWEKASQNERQLGILKKRLI